MKKVLVVSLLAATTFMSNAANVSSTIAGIGASYSAITGSAQGNFSGGFFDINGSLDGDAGFLPSSGLVGYVEGPVGFSRVALTINPLSNEFGAGFALSSTSAGAGFPTGYFLKFYTSALSSTAIASGALKVGTVSTPEPQTYAMAAGAALLGFAAFRRARR